MSDSNGSSSGIGFFGLLGVLFIGLKLTGHVEWSWLWVLSPLWLPLSVLLSCIAVVLLIAGIIGIRENWR